MVLAVDWCLSVCPSITVVYCIQMAKDIARLLSRLGRYRAVVSWLSSPISLYFLKAFWCYAIPRGTDSVGELNTGGGKKLQNCRQKSPFISEMGCDRPMIAMEQQ